MASSVEKNYNAMVRAMRGFIAELKYNITDQESLMAVIAIHEEYLDTMPEEY